MPMASARRPSQALGRRPPLQRPWGGRGKIEIDRPASDRAASHRESYFSGAEFQQDFAPND